MGDTTKNEIAERVIDIIVDKCEMPRKEVTLHSNLKDDLHFDSLGAVELCMEVEKEWNLAFDDTEMEKLTNVQSMVDLVEKKLAAK